MPEDTAALVGPANSIELDVAGVFKSVWRRSGSRLQMSSFINNKKYFLQNK